MFEGMGFSSGDDRSKYEVVIQKLLYETYESFILNSREKSNEESVVPMYVTTLRTLAQTCKFCALLDSLIRDRLVLRIKDKAIQKKLLQDHKLTLSRAIDSC